MQKLIVFEIESILIGVPIIYVERAIRAVTISQIPNAPEFLLGVINIHGELAAIIDIRKRLQLPPKRISSKDYIVLLSHNKERFGFLVDNLIGYVEVNPHKSVDSTSVINESSNFSNVTDLNGRILLIAEPKEFLKSDELEIVSNSLKNNVEN